MIAVTEFPAFDGHSARMNVTRNFLVNIGSRKPHRLLRGVGGWLTLLRVIYKDNLSSRDLLTR